MSNANETTPTGAQKSNKYSNISISASTMVPVTDEYMGTVIGKGGKTIEHIKKECDVRIRTMKAKPEEGHLVNNFRITGKPENVDKAARWVRSIIGNTYKQDQPDNFPETSKKSHE